MSIFCAQCAVHSALCQPQLSSQATISLLTCSPGKALYEAFGHSAFRVVDPENNMDITFNYGTFDFDKPGFYANYAQGRPVFMLSVAQTKYFIRAYQRDNRSVFEDVLNLTPEQNRQLFDRMWENYKPENREYVYDYIYDNCSTRLRDLVAKLLREQVVFDSSHITRKYSFRELMDLHLKPQPWGDLAIDLALGSEIDATASPYQYMFLPYFLQSGFQNAKIYSDDTAVSLVKKSEVIFEAAPEEMPKNFFTPAVVFWLLFLVFAVLSFRDWRRSKSSLIPDMIFFFLLGLVGILLTHISFFSDHHARGNFNLLWALPSNLVFALLLPLRKSKLVGTYFLLAAIAALAVLIGSYTLLPQEMHYALIPIILTVGMRGVGVYLNRNKSGH